MSYSDSVMWKCYCLGKSEAGKTKDVNIIKMMTNQKLSWVNGSIFVQESIGDPKTMEISETGYEWK